MSQSLEYAVLVQRCVNLWLRSEERKNTSRGKGNEAFQNYLNDYLAEHPPPWRVKAEEIVKLRQQGLTYIAIGKLLGISGGRAHYIAERYERFVRRGK